MPDAVLFDLDNTLLDRTASLEAFVRFQADGMLRTALEDTDRFVSRFIELDSGGRIWKDEVYRQLIDEFGIADWSIEELLSVYTLTFCAFSRSRPGVVAAVRTLHDAGYRLGLISNGRTPFQERNFAALGLAYLFDTVVISEAVGLRKPDRRIFELGCERLGTSTDASIFVGDDAEADMRGAKAAGMDTVHVPVAASAARCASADITCDDFQTLSEAIASFGRRER